MRVMFEIRRGALFLYPAMGSDRTELTGVPLLTLDEI